MAVSRIDDDDVDLRGYEGIQAVYHVVGNADSCGGQQAAVGILRRIRVFRSFFNIFNRDQALQIAVLID